MTRIVLLTLLTAVVGLLNILWGSVHIDATQVLEVLTGTAPGTADETARYIILYSRVPAAVTAAMGGAALACAGLMLQTAFRNPLAGPSVLGITSGASLGVAVVMLACGGSMTIGGFDLGGNSAIMVAAFAGSAVVMALLVAMARVLRSSLMLLVAGIMVGYLASSVIMLLNFSSSADGIAGYVMWGMSSFAGVTTRQLPLFCTVTAIGLALAMSLVKPLDLLLLGNDYALNLGVNTRRVRTLLLLATGILTATVTACCGPVSFLGISVPHITRLIFPHCTHRLLLPATMLTGAATALVCNLVCTLPQESVLPLNAVTPLIGAPVVLWILLDRRYR